MVSEAEQKFVDLLKKPKKSKADLIEMEKAGLDFDHELKLEIKQLIAELQSVGIHIDSVWDLVNTRQTYAVAIPILVNHLFAKYHDRNIEGIVRSLAVKEAKGKASAALIELYHRTPKNKMNLRWVIGNSVNVTCTKADMEKILPIVQDKENGYSRMEFIEALGKVKSEKIEDVIIDLLSDPELDKTAIHVLGKMRSVKAAEKIEQFLSSPDALMRKEAEKALKRILGK